MYTFLKEAKGKQKRTTFARIHRLACQLNTLPCAPSILKHRVSAEVCLFLKKGLVPSIYAKLKDLLDTGYPRNEGRLANRFFPRNVLWTFLWDPTEKRQYPNIPPPPPQKKKSISCRIGCFRSSKMTDPGPCPTGWAYQYFRALSRSTKTCQFKLKPTTSYQLQKSIFLRGLRNITGQNNPSPNVYRTFLGKN